MLGTLNEMQIDHFLLSQTVGRIACTDGKVPYIVPITYMYDGTDIISQTIEGKKLAIMRTNPNVCFEVDSMSNMANWQSVIISGTFRELKGKEAIKARDYLFNHLWPLLTSSTIHPHEHGVSAEVDDTNRIKPVMFKIKVRNKSGRFERQ
jgi:nitroimidazol reductase NimA-like FMN-containing flavoprotein (pyridoxamine 5'-phosphate oxidase superfamily)